MVDAASLESRLSFEPPAPPPVDQTADSRDAERPQSADPAPVSAPVPAPATDSIDLSEAAQSVARSTDPSAEEGSVAIAPTDSGNSGSAQVDATSPAPPIDTEPLASDSSNNSATVASSSQSPTTEPIAQTESDPLATNQDSSLALEEAGNDTLNETEAGRTLGQVIDVFA